MTIIGFFKRSYKHHQLKCPSTSLSLSSPLLSSSSLQSIFFTIRTTILSTILVFLLLLILLQDNQQPDFDHLIDFAALEERVQSSNPVLILSYKSPFDENLFTVHYRNNDDSWWKLPRFDLFRHQSVTNLDSKWCQNRNKGRTERYSKIWRRLDASVNGQGLWHDEDQLEEVMEALRTACIVQVDLMEDYAPARFGRKYGKLEQGDEKNYGVGDGGNPGEVGDGGWVVTLEGGQKATLKIVWEAKGEMKRGGLCSEGFELPSSEVASFHVQRLLGMKRAPIAVGRRLNLLVDILPNSSPSLSKLISIKEGISGNETCVMGRCRSCRTQHILCPAHNLIEVSITHSIARKSTPLNAWHPSINQSHADRCKHLSSSAAVWRHAKVFDMAIFNTLVGNPSSNYLSLLPSTGGDEGAVVSFDNARSFCDYNKELNLEPLIHCCKIRKSTYDRVKSLQKEGFSQKLRASMEKDHLAPVLKNAWYPLLDDRLQAIIGALEKCISKNGLKNILV